MICVVLFRLSTDKIHAFMNQRNVIEVAKFAQQLQNRVENLMEAKPLLSHSFF